MIDSEYAKPGHPPDPNTEEAVSKPERSENTYYNSTNNPKSQQQQNLKTTCFKDHTPRLRRICQNSEEFTKKTPPETAQTDVEGIYGHWQKLA